MRSVMLDSREGVTYRGALQFEGRCDLFWETGTQIGSHMPASVVTDEGEEGSAYPMDHGADNVFESESAK